MPTDPAAVVLPGWLEHYRRAGTLPSGPALPRDGGVGDLFPASAAALERLGPDAFAAAAPRLRCASRAPGGADRPGSEDRCRPVTAAWGRILADGTGPLASVLHPDVEAHSDGGSDGGAYHRCVRGAPAVLALFEHLAAKQTPRTRLRAGPVNGRPGACVTESGRLDLLLACEQDCAGAVVAIVVLRDKLRLESLDPRVPFGLPG